ncbi:MAG: hypothetical protein V4635_05300 [Bacteroidota bacterium]
MLTFCWTIFSGQTIDFNQLTGTWYCYKATQGATDMTEIYRDHYSTFNPDLTYIEERRYYYNTYTCTYKLDKKTKTIAFQGGVSTTKYPNARVPMQDLVQYFGIQNEIIVSLDKDNLVVLLKKGGELQGDTKLFYRRGK